MIIIYASCAAPELPELPRAGGEDDRDSCEAEDGGQASWTHSLHIF